MDSSLPIYPFESQRYIGTVSEVGPTNAKVNLPKAANADGVQQHGYKFGAGEVGEFVMIDCGDLAVFGRIVYVKLPERERLSVEPEYSSNSQAHPVGTIQLLTTLSLRNGEITGGINQFPRLGCRVYSAHPLLVKWIAEATQRDKESGESLTLDVANLPTPDSTVVSITPERLFGRHCAVLGATGGGKSWTLARLIEQAARYKAKVILLDATGEFHTLKLHVTHVHLGVDPSKSADSKEVALPYSQLTENDLFALFKPSGQTQAPKLRAAMKSLKIAALETVLATNGVVEKAGKSKIKFNEAGMTHVKVIEGPKAEFDITKLCQQIEQECVWPTDFNDATKWGKANENEKSYCVSLMTRVEDMLSSSELACIFQPEGKPSLLGEIGNFLKQDESQIFRICLKHLSFTHNAREIVANAIGRHLLQMARQGDFRDQPLLIFLDEAHQFLNKYLGDDNSKYPLDTFELIAKEGRKFWLNICISTQRPRDIPEGVLSQMGTLIVHRLINEKDRDVVESASGDIDRSAAAFLPTLSPGQAIIIGVDFAVPLTIQVCKPNQEPDSKGPAYQKHWNPSKKADSGSSVTVEPKIAKKATVTEEKKA